ncbi:RNA polymerase sigma-70 factor [Adhaeribacter arboris]|uniref:RNA polymerase sigma-70 factor n=1 Tax=Adhaeribacter arboris TaxID=2072846 RepID=A0A2T2YE01_9BACT|nr:RNA polymerase sigma-70 factor [Adhaeribacter arboris]PSR53734.1 RNA polymerase sigma-70 factor [Adhaeribacter arboris]
MVAEKSGGKIISLYPSLSPEEKVEWLFRKYYASLCRSLYRTLRDANFAEDIVQEVFLKVWEMRESLQMDEAIQAYLYRSCYNTALNFLKTQKPKTDIDTIGEIVPGSDSAEKHVNFLETETQVLQAIDSLPPKTKLVFSMSRFEELSYKEIADRLDISLKSVEKHMGIALQRLRENLKEYLVGLLSFILSDFF